MRHTRAFKHYPTFALIIVLSSMLLLLGACADRNTPTPASASAPAPVATVALPATTTSVPEATAAQVAEPTVALATATVPPTQTTVPTVVTVPTATALPPTTKPVPTATTEPVTATATTRALPTPTKVPPATRAVPTPGKADSKADGVGVSILAVKGTSPGKNASATIQTSPMVECEIVYTVPSGVKSTAKGLGKQISDGNGRITWNWLISEGTKPGKGSVRVTCGDSTETAPITIG